jgi:hypothetical protein
MLMIMMWTVGMLTLVASTAAAQDGLRSASLPESTVNATVSEERDLFRVPPDFYNRPPDPGPSRLFFPLPTLAVPGWYVDPYRPPRIPTDSDRAVRPSRVVAAPEPSLAPAPALSLTPPPPSVSGKPKTFYVIPGCYAGDKPPEAAWLPAGCDSSRLRVVPPQ